MNTFKKIALMAVVAAGVSAPAQAIDPITLTGAIATVLGAGSAATGHFVGKSNAKRGVGSKWTKLARNVGFGVTAAGLVTMAGREGYNRWGKTDAPVTAPGANAQAPATVPPVAA